MAAAWDEEEDMVVARNEAESLLVPDSDVFSSRLGRTAHGRHFHHLTLSSHDPWTVTTRWTYHSCLRAR